jgi:hypothetical protein
MMLSLKPVAYALESEARLISAGGKFVTPNAQELAWAV